MDILDLVREAISRTPPNTQPQDVILTMMSEIHGVQTHTLAECLKTLASNSH